MIEFDGSVYYIDTKAFDKSVLLSDKDRSSDNEETIKEVFDGDGKLVSREVLIKNSPKTKEIDGVKYGLFQQLLDYVLESPEVSDDKLGDAAFSETPLSYRIAFNTLYKEGIIKEKE